MPSVSRFTACLAGLVLVASGSIPAAATPAPAPASKASTSYATVTLITGDKVTLTKADNGRIAVLPKAAKGREGTIFGVRQHGKIIEVYPNDAVALVAQGRLDKRLFDVAGLVVAGYDDAKSATLPLIVEGSKAKARGITSSKALRSINGSAIKQQKNTAFWTWLTGRTKAKPGLKTSLNDAVTKVWLDGKVHAALDKSVAQIRAPQAWKVGYTGKGVRVAVLDTGIDTQHPDLKGKVTASRDFTGTGSAIDDHGHGTHVASIITGTGAKSGGKLKGVAPGATLANGKVLDVDGIGYESGIIAGMDWAALEVKARVINMSIGGDPSDGTDPLSLAVNRLAAATGALFVVAAGNTYDRGTINRPGAADAALTVAAADRDLSTAEFSSKGPRMNDHALKPDMSAPGVNIAAARASGTDFGTPLNAFYTRLSGTSMATPHVAGAAAVLAQQQPTWKAGQLKTALVSTANRAPASPWEQGAGFLNVERAINPQVWSTSGHLSVLAKWPHDKAIRKQVTYTNRTSKPVRLNVAFTASDTSGAALARGIFAPVPKTVTVPAHGTASVPVTIDPGSSKPDRSYVGFVTATGPGGISVRTAVSVYVEYEAYDVTLDYLDRNGKKITSFDRFAQLPVVLDPVAYTYWFPRFEKNGKLVARLPKGSNYSVTENLVTPGHDDVAPSVTMVSAPKFASSKPLTLTLDARRAKPVRVKLDSRAKRDHWVMEVMEAVPGDQWQTAVIGSIVPPDAYVLGTAPIVGRDHQFSFYEQAVGRDKTYEVAVGTKRQLPADPTYRVRDSELATIDVDLACGGIAYPDVALYAGLSVQANGLRFAFDYARDVTMPSTRRHLVTTRLQGGAARWFSMATGLDGDRNAVFSQGTDVLTYAPGQRVHRDYFHAAFVPGLEGGLYSDGNLVVSVDPVSSSTGFVGVDHAAVTGTMSLQRNGVQVAADKQLILTVPEMKGTATYTVRAEATHKLPWLKFAHRIEGTWTFKAAPPADDDNAGLPVLTPRVSGAFDAWGYAPAGRRFPLDLAVTGAGIGKVAKPTVSISYDDGASWRTLTVTTRNGRFTVAPKLPDVASGHATLRIKATDSKGNAVDLTSYRSFGISDQYRSNHAYRAAS